MFKQELMFARHRICIHWGDSGAGREVNRKILQNVSTGLTVDEAARVFPVQRSVSQSAETRCSSFFCLSGDCLDPERCSFLLGVKPTEAHIKGDVQPLSGFPASTGEWSIEHDWQVCKSLRNAVEAFWPRLLPLKGMISKCVSEQQLSASFCAAFEVFGKDYPDLELSSAIIGHLVDMDAEFSIDWYDYSDFKVILDDERTNIGALGSCNVRNSSQLFVYEVMNLKNESLGDVVGRVLDGLHGKIGDKCDVTGTVITVFVEVHQGEVPLLVLPIPVLKAMRSMLASLNIKWRRIS